MSLFRKAFVISFLIFILLALILVSNSAVSVVNHLKDETNHFVHVATRALGEKDVPESLKIKWMEQALASKLLVIDTKSSRAIINIDKQVDNGLLSVLHNQVKPMVSSRFSVDHYDLVYTPITDKVIVRSIINTAAAVSALLLVFLICFFLIRKAVQIQVGRNIDSISSVLETMISNPRTVMPPENLAKEFEPMKRKLERVQKDIVEELEEIRDELPALRDEAYNDELTGIPNKKMFIKALHERVDSGTEIPNGVMSIIRATSLELINRTQGYRAGDEYLKKLGEILKRTADSYPNAEAYRLTGSDFGLIIDRLYEPAVSGLAESLTAQFSSFMRETELESIAHIGFTLFKAGDKVGDLLSYCDNAQSIAQTKGVNGWYLEKPNEASRPISKQNWRELLEQALEEHKLVLYGQSIKPLRGDINSYVELQSRFQNSEGEYVPTHSLISQAEVLGYYVDIDKMIVEEAIKVAKSRTGYREIFGVNLSNRSALDVHFTIWLERVLLKDPAVARRLVFEVSEHGLHRDLKACQRFADAVHRAGARYTIEHFGSSMLSFKYFREMNPDYVKLDGSHTRDAESDTKLQYFIRLLVDVTHRMGVKVIAEAVETQEQKQILELLHVDAIQGYFVDRPTPINY